MDELTDNLPWDFPGPQSTPSIIKVIGVGGGGGNAVSHMYKEGIQDVTFVLCNTDNQALLRSEVPRKVQLGKTTTEGLGAGNRPERARLAAEESIDEIKDLFNDGTKMVFITAGMVAALQPQASSDKHRLIEIDEACKITRKAKPTIYTLARKGLIPAYKRGKKLYFYEDELLQWIESGRKQMQVMSLQEQAAEIVHGAKRKPKRGYNF